jgi:hypothetical protein
MKDKIRSKVMLSMTILAFGFIFFGCNTGNDPGENNENNPFKGTWSWTGSGTVVSGNYTFGITSINIIFTDDTYDLSETIISVNGNSNSMNMKTKGKYTYDGNIASVIQEQHSSDGGNTWTNEVQPAMEYKINGNVLSFPLNVTTITLTKQN